MTDVAAPAPPRAREVRAQMREWRRGRAELKVWEVFGDVYIAVFTVAMVGSMAGSVVVNLRRVADVTCVGRCADVRSVAPWLLGLGLVLATLAVSRLLGPVFSPPAMNSWVLGSPVARGPLLAPALTRGLALAGLIAGVLLLGPGVLSGFGFAETTVFIGVWVATCIAAVALAAVSQVRSSSLARVLTWSVAVGLWALLALTSAGHLTEAPPTSAVVIATSVAAVVAVATSVVAWRALPRMSRRVLAQTEHLSPSLSGALSGMDLGLMYDVLLARRWGGSARVRSRRGGPAGWWALVHRDTLRIARSPQPWLLLAASTLVPYAASAASAGLATVLVVTLCGLVIGPAMLSGLRVVSRTGSVLRMLPQSRQVVRLAHLVVPGSGLVLHALACLWALPGQEPLLALACGLASVAAAARWVTAPPPDYARPLVSTPAGGIPTGLVGSLLRGIDVWLLTSVPLLFPGPVAIGISLVLSLGVLAWLVTDEGRAP